MSHWSRYILTLVAAQASAVLAMACGSESLGSNKGAVASDGTDGGACAITQCFRPVECASACGAAAVSTGCCPCATGLVDLATCGGRLASRR
jgi:hypothetical protein